MKVLVTGANGVLGTNAVLEFLNRNYKVKALVRNRNKFIDLAHPNLELVEGDITDKNCLDSIVEGCQYVVHSAANTAQDLLHLMDYHDANVKGTENIINLCEKHKITRLVYVGTANTFGFGSLEAPGNEKRAIRPPFSESLYAQSKIQAQQLIDRAANDLDIVTVSPTFLIGAYDSKPSSGKIILMAQKKVIFYPSGGKNFVSVKDAAIGIVNALEIGKKGEAYLLANENLSYKTFFKMVADQTGNKPMLIKVPNVVLLSAGIIGDLIRKLGFKTELSGINTQILTVRNYYSNQKAKKELNLSFTPIDEAVSDALSWFRENGMIQN